ncbi:PAS domain-containing protein [Dyadobacter chenwenxiniae]|uniref:histidine kinase n=1 Tax=Dyadobacter chenwenxiniae TaxID=2906456 RepID=A0A9X1PQ89_9BACT|nr:chemotaxis protein CheB [Dyadobacter chenwenxiniae]MCF0064429.1 PAS domain-containing protein [Dyadobacter chenwenxiniae]UON82366.1 PAS domain-containing protein [Dyadobacter chenwenxiniae]
MFTAEPHHIIAIGASAGGLDELNTFFDHTPSDGVSYIIVQHLSAEFQSHIVALLSRHSKLVVQQAENGIPIQGNKVYTIPNDKIMTVRDHSLYLTDKQDERSPHMTINTFFQSLASDYGTKAIAVVLSGLGSDGTDGIKAIKKAGGLVIAREPDGTEFHSMPANAIATGMVDYILEPEAMPAAIEDYVKRELDLLATSIHDEEHVGEIIALINQKLPLDFSDYKQSTILRRIKRRAASNNFIELQGYIQFIKANPGELEVLAKDFLISVTAFFRDTESFEFVESQVIPAIMADLTPLQEIRVWVTGCATGEEAYSMAMLISEQLGDRINDHVVKIFATDIDGAALSQAGKGVYKTGVLAGLSQQRLKRFFTKEGNDYKVMPELRKMVIFAQHDLVKNPPYCNMHFISCRNVLIYMTPSLQKKIYQMLLFGLRPQGYLFLGSSENPLPIMQSLKVISKRFKVYKNQGTQHPGRFESYSLPDVPYKKLMGTAHSQEQTYKIPDRTLGDAINETLMKDLEQLVICIDPNEKIVKFYGDTTKFLLQKIMTSEFTELLPGPLAVAYKTVFNIVLQSGETSSVTGINIKQGEDIVSVTLTVSPMVYKGRSNGFLVVRISEEIPGEKVVAHGQVFNEQIYFDQYTQSLEQEVKDLKEKLMASNEKLYAQEENMQSFNEELLSANEEMQSTSEEMQSINEELHTINSDYQLKNKELLALNDDLNNYFRSNVNGQLFLDDQLRLIKYSPGAVKLINLLESDIGRPLANISTNFKIETIIEDINAVLSGDAVITKEIQTKNGKWFQVMTMPYIKQLDNKTSGAIITFNDITDLKIVQQQLDKKNEALMRINADLDNFVHTASHDLLDPLASIEVSISLMSSIDTSDPEIKEVLPIINGSVKKFRALISEIAVVAKIENNALETEPVDIDELLDNIEWSLDERVKSSGAVIKRDVQVKQVIFSKKNLRSILYNLIANGIKYRSERRPLITVRIWAEGNQTVLSVEDNGLGMEKRHLDAIFEKYTRLNAGGDGYGIGLYLASKIVNAAGGRIAVESEPGVGSKFVIYLNN